MLLRAVEAVLRGRDKEWPETGLALWEDVLAGRAVDLLANLRVARLWVWSVAVQVRPATADRWSDLVRVFGRRGEDPSWCWCQRFLGSATRGSGIRHRTSLRRICDAAGISRFQVFELEWGGRRRLFLRLNKPRS
jgi:hypothetical protein